MTTDTSQTLFAAGARALRSGAYQQAIESFETYLKTNPIDRKALVGIAEAYRFFNRSDRIVELYERALATAPDDQDIRAGFIEALMADVQTGKAREIAQSAIASYPDSVRFQLQFAQTDMMLGHNDEARRTFWRCLELDPENADCVFYLSQLATPDELPRITEIIKQMWSAKEKRDAWEGATLGYAYGKLAERQKDFETAWEAYSFGAKTRRRIVRFDEQTYSKAYDAHRITFTGTTPLPLNKEDAGKGFVFIVSLPRSGSTLVERILDAHPRVESIGERSIVFDAVDHWQRNHGPRPETSFRPEAFDDARQFYEKGARGLMADKNAVVVDKSITNFVFLGFLRTIMPRARFVHVVRDPLDTAVSCFTTSFYAGNEWTYDLAEIGRNIRRYQKIMAHWMSLWPDDILTVRYEDLVSDPEAQTRQIVNFCNLEWDPACLKFHESKRQVMTASMLQVRQPIYQSAKGRAANYEKHLGPLVAAMGRRAADPDWYLTSK